MSTAHIEAQMGDFAETVLMPGDPLRAKFIAENFLDDAKCVTRVRNMFGYTGTYKGKRISVMGSGMGIPSVSIYATELYKDYGVEEIIRIGSCGAVRDDIHVRDIVIGMAASTDSNVNRQRLGNVDFAACADFSLLKKVVDTAEKLKTPVHVGNIFTADLFYTPNPEMFAQMEKYGMLAVEMEAAGLYGVAAEYGKKALTVLTVSDHIKTGEVTTADERETTFKDMMELTLESIL
ncbi:purine nucleoside phosphorylase DeoD-type 1 [Psychrosphaera saromensis]|uniref:Purine nucleoside phosphorylase DeoD-type n=1 Tax=Psychrosphaera saromensis TaxID=716813 RepID=A0A2S7UTC4_9GAMM|nr:purine-nucleoside phosphorylase [Psychrosphaera saromensis]PQJ52531.1 purine-nucleoside phosphorylase [Psychrosphaera saromensis]GHB69226.1 purine nucleoside phosphorylase DeoD-type 1 [Psychrosphaera saromensis]GLQ12995.1 purine nucleoside phosphorylase DeoD-type 1 [Psychrosphaera saromensis]